ncbi:MAG: hypothetical protein OEZ02_08595, partial [Anaerolineae bacterium]|nr:hypothetical protein [Anaerolineae bacterium]
FIQGMSRISHFWGFSRGMGAIYGAIYLSPHPLSLDDLVEQAAVTKGAVSTNARQLERLGMVHKHIKVGERKDYYTAETNFWKIVKSVLKEREKSEFDLAIKTVGESLQMAQDASNSPDAQLAAFYQQRLSAMQAFFNTLDNLVAMVLALDEFRLSAFQKFFGSSQQKEK